MESTWDTHPFQMGLKIGTNTLENSLGRYHLLKLYMCMPYDPSISLLGIDPTEINIYAHQKTWTLEKT